MRITAEKLGELIPENIQDTKYIIASYLFFAPQKTTLTENLDEKIAITADSKDTPTQVMYDRTAWAPTLSRRPK